MNKKITALFLSVTVGAALFTGCKNANTGTGSQSAAENAAETAAAVSEAQTADTKGSESTENVSETESTAETEVPAETVIDTKSMTALEFSVHMGNGINLGNTHEAYGHGSQAWDTDPLVFERLWGQPNTTQEIINGMKAAGFDTVRVPVAWTNGMDYESGDYTINPALLDRIGEVIDYCINADMNVIVNDHWDGSWWGMFGSADETTRNNAMEMYKSMWTQIGERYKDYPDNLIFESANEELGDRLNDTDVAKNSGTLSNAECYATTNLINQTFVDLIRSQGSNNADRFLLIAGYNTDIEHTISPQFKMPADSADHKLFVSVHYYNPSTYCINKSIDHWGSAKEYAEMNELMQQLTKFTDEGYGVIIGEYGVLTDGSSPRPDWELWFNNFINNCDKYNYVPMLWDCNGLYNKSSCTIPDEGVAKFFTEHSNAAREGMTQEDIVKTAEEGIAEDLAAAEEKAADEMAELPDENTALCWIMYQSGDWSVSYSVGDVFDPTARTEGIKPTNPIITGEGEYTVALDFTDVGRVSGCQFSAIGITNGEQLYPGCIINIKSIKINGEEAELAGTPYTASDDGKCTRVNLYNQWEKAAPGDARLADGQKDPTAQPLIIDDKQPVKTLEVTFDFVVD